MRTASVGIQNFLASGAKPFRADLYTVTTAAGTVYRWTTWERDLVVGGQTYSSSSPILSRGRVRQSMELEMDALELQCDSTFQIGGQTFAARSVTGYWRGASFQLDLLFMPTPGDVSLGPISSWFTGTVGEVEPGGATTKVRVRSDLSLLDQPIPRFVVQPSCFNVLFDANCALSRAAFQVSGTVTGTVTPTPTIFSTSLVQATGYFDRGLVRFYSRDGDFLRISAAIPAGGYSATNGAITLDAAMPFTPAVGDAFYVWPGCAHTLAECQAKFNNLGHYRGTPGVPIGGAP